MEKSWCCLKRHYQSYAVKIRECIVEGKYGNWREVGEFGEQTAMRR